jgi:hypothetical protein
MGRCIDLSGCRLKKIVSVGLSELLNTVLCNDVDCGVNRYEQMDLTLNSRSVTMVIYQNNTAVPCDS